MIESSHIPKWTDQQIRKQSQNDLNSFFETIDDSSSQFPIYPDEILEVLWGVEVVYDSGQFTSSSSSGEELAFYTPVQQKVYVNDSVSGFRVRLNYTLAHEVGHLSLHGYLIEEAKKEGMSLNSIVPAEKKDRVEKEAEKYASYLLMPSSEMRKQTEKLTAGPDNSLDLSQHGKELCEHFNVSRQALEIRLNDFPVNVEGREYVKKTYNPFSYEMDQLEEERVSWTL